jgi:hypothetical protein
MPDPKSEEPVRQRELPKTNEPVERQPANDRPVGGQAVGCQGDRKDERGHEQPANKNRALHN